tara:strand:- start:5161 stop:5901 length:741 start_codon:yes stop_codon:yes gene_type:complete
MSLEKFISSDGNIDGTALSNEWFPDIGEIHVFISHSHQDLGLARMLANWLYDNFRIKSFIDSEIWGYADNLLKEIDNKYAKNTCGTTYNYDIRNQTTSHVHMMLSSALNTMIDKSECLIFLNTENALRPSDYKDEDRTSSPWIMSEIHTSTIIRKNMIPGIREFTKTAGLEHYRSLNESVMDATSPNIDYKVDISHLNKVFESTLLNWVNSSNKVDKGYYALTYLYNQSNGSNLSNINKTSNELTF